MFRICRIITETLESTNNLKKYLGGYPVEITQKIPQELYFDVPTLIVGWNSVKDRLPKQEIGTKKVTHNLSWTYNESECKETLDKESFHKNIDTFVNTNLYAWLPRDFKLFDSIIHGSLHDFIKDNIDTNKLTYTHFNKGAIYMRNDGNDFIINVESLKITEKDYKFTVTRIFNNLNCFIYSYNGIEDFADLDLLSNIKALDIMRWIEYGVETPINYFQIVPGIDVSKYVPFLMSKVPLYEFDEDEQRFFERMCVRDKITRWMSSRQISFTHDFKKNLDFVYREHAKLAKINYSTKRTLTGRIVSRDNYNPQNLDKKNEERTKIISRFRNGRIYQFDYTSFEAKIALYLSGDDFFIENYYSKDLHAETSCIIYDTPNFTTEQRDVAKLINHTILYGAGEATILSRLKGIPYSHEKIIEVKRFLSPIIKKSEVINSQFEEKGYIINRWGSIIRPEKSYATFNNLIQSTATEIVVDKVIEIKELLVGYKSQFMFQVHDSLVFDIHPEERGLLSKINDLLSYSNGMIFTINIKSGINYKNLF